VIYYFKIKFHNSLKQWYSGRYPMLEMYRFDLLTGKESKVGDGNAFTKRLEKVP